MDREKKLQNYIDNEWGGSVAPPICEIYCIDYIFFSGGCICNYRIDPEEYYTDKDYKKSHGSVYVQMQREYHQSS